MNIDIKVPDLIPLVQALLPHAGPAALLLLVAGLVLGVLVPAVWSQRSTRRCAAAAVLDRILQTVERIAAVSARLLARVAFNPPLP
ncbi:hypothetical protein [Actinomycetospora lemnae]|uniref:Uncharacterized protein n=1 Tax=Actinomycetospora lemnae TaxID=3019891 RepID=A0ABT5STD6_9PSEU|nr:hypothetical protein [Actinomycetospora sp. DW7H6]MDD7966115.1 hypothetical protein [Actinomycetospora sp. DW7H6]